MVSYGEDNSDDDAGRVNPKKKTAKSSHLRDDNSDDDAGRRSGKKKPAKSSAHRRQQDSASSSSSVARKGKKAPGTQQTLEKPARTRRAAVPRANHPKEVIDVLTDWLAAHMDDPYPTEPDKVILMDLTGLNPRQINDWYINARRRVLPRLLEEAEEAMAAEEQAEGDVMEEDEAVEAVEAVAPKGAAGRGKGKVGKETSE